MLVFDEVSAGWRDVCGGRHLQYGVAPDIATFSKTISNGFVTARAGGFTTPSLRPAQVGVAAVSQLSLAQYGRRPLISAAVSRFTEGRAAVCRRGQLLVASLLASEPRRWLLW